MIVAPGGVVGILGGGQLARMLAGAAARLGLSAHVFAPEADACAFAVTARQTRADYDDEAALASFAAAVDVVTVEFESIPVAALQICARHAPVRPGAAAFAAAQDRLAERALLAGLGIAVAPHRTVLDDNAIAPACAALGPDVFLKRARGGYDGKGQLRLRGPQDIAAARAWLKGAPALAEAAVTHDFECSVVAVRGGGGEMAFYDIAENCHENGILRESRVPSRLAAPAHAEAQSMARAIAEGLDYIGVLAVEMFAMSRPGGHALIVNEIAPRVHNSGHWTLEACATGQFENHIRAICGWPLGDTVLHCPARLVNVLGDEVADWAALAAAGNLTLYGKGAANGHRKMGHVTYLGVAAMDSAMPDC